MVADVIKKIEAMFYLFVIFVSLLISCASGDTARYFPVLVHRDSTKILFNTIEDSLNKYDFYVRTKKQDTIIASKMIKQGALNEREVQMLFSLNTNSPYCRVQVKITTFFRQDTIIEFYDEAKGFPASNRRDFMDALKCIQKIGENTLPKKQKKKSS